MNKYLKWSNIWILIIVGLSVIIMAGQLLSDANAVHEKRTEDGYRILEYFEKKESKDKTAPIGKRYEYTKLIEKMPPQSSGIVFCAVHQNVSVYLDKELVYEVTPPKRSVFGKSPGTNWVIVPLYQSDKGKTLKIVMTPIYEHFAGVLPTIYYGSPTKILTDFLRQKMIPVVLCVIIFAVGTVFFCLGLWNYKNSKKGIDIVMIGLFAVILALWRISDYSVTKLFVENVRAVSAFTLVLVMFFAPTFLVYSRCLFSDKSHKLWSIAQYVLFGVISVSLVFQLLGIADLRQTLWLHHMTLIMTALLIAYMIFREVKLGDKVEAYVSRITEDNRVDLSLQQKGFAQVKDSAEVLYDAIVAAGGKLALTDNSSPEEIRDTLNMSKKLFKRSLGVLMSHNRVVCADNEIKVKE